MTRRRFHRRFRATTDQWIGFVVALILLATAMLLVAGWRSAPLPSAIERSASQAPANVQAFYIDRAFRPLWSVYSSHWPLRPRAMLLPEAFGLAERMMQVLPQRRAAIAAAVMAARQGEPAAVARAEILLSTLLDDYRRRLHEPLAAARPAFVDPAFAPRAKAVDTLGQAAAAPSLRQYLDEIDRVNPVYDGLAAGLARYRETWSSLPKVAILPGPALGPGDDGPRVTALRRRLGLVVDPGAGFDPELSSAVSRFQSAHGLPATGRIDASDIAALNRSAGHYERLILANMERARALPPAEDGRFILVNIPAARLWAVDRGHASDTMRVVVGTRSEQTPAMVGQIRFAVVNPYWNLPPDIVRDRIAPQILRAGPSYFARRNFEALSDWSPSARRIDAQAIDWKAVAHGDVALRVRQRPGGDNQMGRVKFMLPNELGIYLHDTPDKALFRRNDRLASAGCVRVEDAPALSRWLFGSDRLGTRATDRHIDLPRSTMVYIAYLTALPTSHGIAFFPDIYGRDPTLLAALRMT